MPIADKEATLKSIAPISGIIVSCVLDAWADWRASPYAGRWRCKRSRANFVWEQIVDKCIAQLTGREGVHIERRDESFGFFVNDDVFFRIKKADRGGLTSNVPTQSALAFHDPEKNLFGFRPIQRVEVVYQLNPLETEVADVAIVARDGARVAWSARLLRSAQVLSAAPSLHDEAQKENQPRKRLTRLKNSDGKTDTGQQNTGT